MSFRIRQINLKLGKEELPWENPELFKNMFKNYDKLFLYDDRKVLFEKHQVNTDYLYIFTSPKNRNNINFKFADYQQRIGISWANILDTKYRVIEGGNHTNDWVICPNLIDFFRYVKANAIPVKQFFVYDIRLLSKRKIVRDFMVFYIKKILKADLYTRKGIFVDDELNTKSKKLMDMLFDFEMFVELLAGQSKIGFIMEQLSEED